MYDLPQMQGVARVVVDADAIAGTGKPVLLADGESLEDARVALDDQVAGGAAGVGDAGGAGGSGGLGGSRSSDDTGALSDEDAAPTADIAIIRPEHRGEQSGSRRA